MHFKNKILFTYFNPKRMVKLTSRFVSHRCAQVIGVNIQNAVLFQEDDKIKAMLTNHQLADDQVCNAEIHILRISMLFILIY